MMVKGQDLEQTRVRNSIGGISQPSPFNAFKHTGEKNRPFNSLLTQLKEKVLQKRMKDQSPRYWRLADIVGEVDDCCRAIDTVIWLKQTQPEKDIQMKNNELSVIISERILRELHKSQSKSLKKSLAIQILRKMEQLEQVSTDTSDEKLRILCVKISTQIQKHINQNPLELIIFD